MDVEIDTQMYELISTKVQSHSSRDNSLFKMVLEKLNIYMQKKNRDPYLAPYTERLTQNEL